MRFYQKNNYLNFYDKFIKKTMPTAENVTKKFQESF